MSYSQEPIPTIRSQWSIDRHGPETPFRHHSVIREYVEKLITEKGHHGLVQYNTTVERAVKEHDTQKWILTIRRRELNAGNPSDYWWIEEFDAVVVASGHYAVPYIPAISGLDEFSSLYPGSVEHTKHYRGPEKYRGKVQIPLWSIHDHQLLTLPAESYYSRCISIGSRYSCQPHRYSTITNSSSCSWSI